MHVTHAEFTDINYSGRLRQHQRAARVVIILHSARRVVKSYYITTSCTNVFTRALSPEETREGVKFLETDADSDMGRPGLNQQSYVQFPETSHPLESLQG